MWSGIYQTRVKLWSFIAVSLLAGGMLLTGLFAEESASESTSLYLGTMAVTDPEKHPLYPRGQFFTAVGCSEDGFNAAEAEAKIGVLRQLLSFAVELEDEVVADDLKAEIMGISNQESTDESMAGYDQQPSHSGYLQMIKIDINANLRVRGRFYAFAYLPRSSVNASLMTEI